MHASNLWQYWFIAHKLVYCIAQTDHGLTGQGDTKMWFMEK